MTTFAAAGPDPTGTIEWTRHSKLIGASATRGGRTSVEGAASTPNLENSLSPYGSVAEVEFIFSARENGTELTTNSGTSSKFRMVSFLDPSRVLAGMKSKDGGAEVTPWKKLNGARFVFPSRETVETQAMGRGRIVLVSQR